MAGEPDWEGLFDFTHPGIQQWEVAAIRAADKDGKLLIPAYARDRARQRDIQVRDIRDTVQTGKPVEKDMPPHPTRPAGIAFAKRTRSGRRIKVKVGYLGGRYSVVTVHPDDEGDRS